MQSHKVLKERNDIKCCVSCLGEYAVCLHGLHIQTYARKKLDEFQLLLLLFFSILLLAFGETKKGEFNEIPSWDKTCIKFSNCVSTSYTMFEQYLFKDFLFHLCTRIPRCVSSARAHTQHHICSSTFHGYYFTPFCCVHSVRLGYGPVVWMWCAGVTRGGIERYSHSKELINFWDKPNSL